MTTERLTDEALEKLRAAQEPLIPGGPRHPSKKNAYFRALAEAYESGLLVTAHRRASQAAPAPSDGLPDHLAHIVDCLRDVSKRQKEEATGRMMRKAAQAIVDTFAQMQFAEETIARVHEDKNRLILERYSTPADDLRAAAQALVDRWDSPAWGGSADNLRHTGEYIAELRAALSHPAPADCASFSAGYEAGQRDGKAAGVADWNAVLVKLQALKAAARQAGLQERLDGIRDAEDAVRALHVSHKNGFTDRQLRDQIVGEG